MWKDARVHADDRGCGWCQNGWGRARAAEPRYLYSLRDPYSVQVYRCSRCATWWEWNPWVLPRIATREVREAGAEYRFDGQDGTTK